MNLKTAILSVFLLASAFAPARAGETPEQKAARMEWFSRAKLGIFIHWGIYSKGETSESWAFHNGTVSLEDYMKQRECFTAEKYDPALWARLIRESGARYTVITTKHHDGFALWDTKAGEVSAVKSSPAGRDLIGPFAEEVRKQGVRLGFYYSLIDWPREDYTDIYRAGPVRYKIADDPARWQHFVDFNFAQLRELNETWRPDLYWFDGDWEHSAEEWHAEELVAMLRTTNPGVVINSRIQGHGDYATPELGVPVAKPGMPWWETCMTMNNSWGYRIKDTDYKSPMTVLRMLADCIGLGGNLLIDIAPRADGTIPDEQVALLRELGRWTGKHAEAVYDTRAGIPAGHVAGYTSLNLKGDILYVYLPYRPNESVEVKGLKSRIKRVRVVGSDRELDWKQYNDISWSEVPGVYYIEVPDEVLDERITVLALELEEPVRLYRGSGQIISFNE